MGGYNNITGAALRRPTASALTPLTGQQDGGSLFPVAQMLLPTLNPFGNLWYVWAEEGNDGLNGLAPGSALASIGEALDRAAARDMILIGPGTYNENVVVTKDYISLIGAVAPGYAKPDIVPDAGKALYVQAAQGIIGIHLRLSSADDDVLLNEGNGFVFADCVFDGDGQSATEGLVRLKGNADDDSYTASEGVIEDCLFRGSGGVGLIFDTGDAPWNGVGCTDDVIRRCSFIGNTEVDIVTQDSGSGATTYSVQRALIEGNFFRDKNKTCYIDFTTANAGAASDQTGAIMGNTFAADAINTTRVAMVGTGFTFGGNFSNLGVVDGTGLD